MREHCVSNLQIKAKKFDLEHEQHPHSHNNPEREAQAEQSCEERPEGEDDLGFLSSAVVEVPSPVIIRDQSPV